MNIEPKISAEINAECDEIFTGINTQNLSDTQSKAVFQKLQEIRLWQLMQQEELKKQQQNQLLLLKSQHMKLDIPEENHDIAKNTMKESDEVLAFPLVNSEDEVNCLNFYFLNHHFRRPSVFSLCMTLVKFFLEKQLIVFWYLES